MKNALVLVVVLAVFAGVWAYMGGYWNKAQQECPDEMIVNRMPGPDAQTESYYIQDGERREVSEYDAEWVRQNCTVTVQEVF